MNEQIKTVTANDNKKYIIGYGHLKETYVGDNILFSGDYVSYNDNNLNDFTFHYYA